MSTILDILLEMEKSLDTYNKYAKKTVNEVKNELKKGAIERIDDPLGDAYYTIV